MSESFTSALKAISTLGRVTVEVVPDDDAQANPQIPKDVLEKLDQDALLISKVGHMLYIRHSHWERIKHHFPIRDRIQ